MLGKMISKVLKLSEYDICQFEMKRKHQSEIERKNDLLKHDFTRYSFRFFLEKNPFEQIYFERMKELGMCNVDPSYIYNRLPDNFYPFYFEEIITQDLHLYFAKITLISVSKLNDDKYERIISGDCLMSNRRICS